MDVTNDDPWESRHAPELEPDYPEVYYCASCCLALVEGNLRGHTFVDGEIVCPDELEEGDCDGNENKRN